MKDILIKLIQFYRKHISPQLPDMCRYYPTCSQYAIEALEIHGAFKGSLLTVARLLRCNILFPGGYDPVPPKRDKNPTGGLTIMDAIYEILGIPFGYVLRFIFEAVDNYGLALILFTLFARLLMIPTSIYQTKGTVKTQRLQPKIRRINAKYKGDQKKIQEETQALYQREGHNPMNMGCLPLAIQFIIIFGLIGVIYHPLKWALAIDETTINSLTEIAKTLPGYNAKTDLRTIELFVINHIDTIRPLALSKGIGAGVIDSIANFNFTFLGIPLGKIPSIKEPGILWAVPILSGLTSLATSLFSMLQQRKNNPEMAKNPTMGCMTFGMPLFSIYFTFQFPAGIGIYWIASNVFALIQTVILSFTHSPKKMIAKAMVDETVERRSREENLKRALAQKKEEK